MARRTTARPLTTPASGGVPAARQGDLAVAMAGFGQTSQNLAQVFNLFNTQAGQLAEVLSKFPTTLQVETRGRLEVIHNGAEVLARMSDGLQQLIVDKVDEAIKRRFKERLPDA
jgi:hypothetical protein